MRNKQRDAVGSGTVNGINHHQRMQEQEEEENGDWLIPKDKAVEIIFQW